MAKEISCRIVQDTDDAMRVLVPIPNHPTRQRQVWLPTSQVDKAMRAGPLVRRDTVYCDKVTVTDWIARKEDL